MKTIFLSLALVTGLTFGLNAQNQQGTKPKPAPEERAKKESAHAEKELGLTADQKTKWEAAALERIRANEPIHDKMRGSTTPEERKTLHGQAKANKDKFDNTVNGFLTADQKTKFEKMKADRRQKMKEKHKGKQEHEIIDDED